MILFRPTSKVLETLQHFESDDPDLYMTKVKYIIENDVTDGGMTFSEEEYSGDGRLLRVRCYDDVAQRAATVTSRGYRAKRVVCIFRYF